MATIDVAMESTSQEILTSLTETKTAIEGSTFRPIKSINSFEVSLTSSAKQICNVTGEGELDLGVYYLDDDKHLSGSVTLEIDGTSMTTNMDNFLVFGGGYAFKRNQLALMGIKFTKSLAIKITSTNNVGTANGIIKFY